MKPEYPPATPLQMGCFKLWQRQMAQELNNSGLSLRAAIEAGRLRMDVPWTEFTFEPILTDEYMKIMYPFAKDAKGYSIKYLDTHQLQTLYEAVNAGCAHAFGVSLPFPSEESLKESRKKK